MLLTKWKPTESHIRFRNDFDKLFDSYFGDFFKESNDLYTISPRADIEETDNEYLVSLEIPGIDKKDLKLNLENNRLTIAGEKTQSKEVKDSNYVSCERNYGSFQRIFELPNTIRSNDISAEYKDGILKVKLPKDEKAKRKEIEIKVK